jgi:hypothetical protein
MAAGNLYQALNTAAAGYGIYPADPKAHKSLLPDGIEGASSDPDVISGWWSQWPDAVVGIVPKKPAIAATSFAWRDPATIPPRRFIYGRHYIRQFASLTVSPAGVGKSSLTIAESLAMVTGRPLLGLVPEERVKVWLWNGEDPDDENTRRVMATVVHYGIKREEFEGRLFVDSGRRMPVVIAEQTRDGARIATPVVDQVIATIEDNGIDVMIVDPFVSSHQVTENDNNAIERVAKMWAKIADQTNCAIELVHHSRKTFGAEVSVEDGRGAGALLAAVRSARVLNAMTEDEAAKAGVEHRRLHFRVENGKANLVKPMDQATWYKLASVELANGDDVGVATAWEWPNPFDNVTTADLRAAQQAVAAGGPWRESKLAADWVGKPIAEALGLDPGSKAHRAKVAGLLAVWMANGMFKRVEGRDPKRRDIRTFVEVGQWAND